MIPQGSSQKSPYTEIKIQRNYHKTRPGPNREVTWPFSAKKF